jgi:hypothetical protein
MCIIGFKTKDSVLSTILYIFTLIRDLIGEYNINTQ